MPHIVPGFPFLYSSLSRVIFLPVGYTYLCKSILSFTFVQRRHDETRLGGGKKPCFISNRTVAFGMG